MENNYHYTKYREIIENGTYHITQRAPGKEMTFIESRDYLYFIHLLKNVSKRFCLTVSSFCLMPNHLHLLLRIVETNLSVAMKSLFEKYAMYFNKKYQRKGHVFCGRYRHTLCLDDPYLLTISVYIHLNPYKAGLCNDFLDYKWSSIGLFVPGSKAVSFVDPEPVLQVLDQHVEISKELYMKILRNSAPIQYNNVFIDNTCLFKLKDTIITNISKYSNMHDVLKTKDFSKNPIDIIAKKYLIEQLLVQGYTMSQIANKLKISRQGLYKTLKYRSKDS